MTAKTIKKPTEYAPLPCGAVLLALDVSSSVTGWSTGRIREDGHADVLDFGIIKPPSGRTSAERSDLMCMRLACIIKQFGATNIVMEFQSYMNSGKRVQGLAVLGQAQGAVRAYLSLTHRVDLVTEREWTKVGGKNARKEARAEHVKRLVPAYAAKVDENPKFDVGLDASDALGILLWRTNR